MAMTPDEVEAVAKAAAEKAVSHVFLHLGVDVENKDELKELKRGLSFLRSWRSSVETVRKGGLVAAVTVITAGALGLIWLSIRGG